MASDLRLGLTLGKFVPLHRGHQLLIETALAEVEQLIVVIYDSPEVTFILEMSSVAMFTMLAVCWALLGLAVRQSDDTVLAVAPLRTSGSMAN